MAGARQLTSVQFPTMNAEEEMRRGMHAEVTDQSPVLDRAKALDRIGGDIALLAEIATLFMQEYPQLLAIIRTACAAGDAREVERAAHSLKGAAANFSAFGTVEAALAVERLARAGDLPKAEEAIGPLEAELARLHLKLAELGS
jgi:HPt (histidine-containing phosphotransfer) domain-containing protein